MAQTREKTFLSVCFPPEGRRLKVPTCIFFCFVLLCLFFFSTERSSQKTERQKKESLIAILAALEPLLSFINSALHQPSLCPPTPHSAPLRSGSSCHNRGKNGQPALLGLKGGKKKKRGNLFLLLARKHNEPCTRTHRRTNTVIYSSMCCFLSG